MTRVVRVRAANLSQAESYNTIFTFDMSVVCVVTLTFCIQKINFLLALLSGWSALTVLMMGETY